MVHNVTSMLCYTLIIAFYFGLWATGKSEGKDQNQPAPKKAEDTVAWSGAKLFQKRQFLSPRVLFSAEPPPSLDLLDSTDSLSKNIRAKRAFHPVHELTEKSTCDSFNVWIKNKTIATNVNGEEVNVVPSVLMNNKNYDQYFFETKCKDPTSSGCRGIDARQWNSYCTTKSSFVLALTEKGDETSWRYISIDTACVCVIKEV